MSKDSVKIAFDQIDKSIYVPTVPCSKVTNCFAYWQPSEQNMQSICLMFYLLQELYYLMSTIVLIFNRIQQLLK